MIRTVRIKIMIMIVMILTDKKCVIHYFATGRKHINSVVYKTELFSYLD